MFEAYNVGNWLVYNQNFIETEYFSVFLTTERHYDSVYSIKDIEKASFCQALVYEVLYLNVFKIPDVMFSVERMLHDPLGESIHLISDENAISDDGREFKLDRSSNTFCILENYKLCHFHNRDFDLFRETIQTNCEQNENDNHRLSRLSQSLLPLKEISCVRQLLNLGITPFPYIKLQKHWIQIFIVILNLIRGVMLVNKNVLKIGTLSHKICRSELNVW